MGAKTRATRGADKKTQINNSPDEILSYYLGPPHDEGARLLWDCRECGKHHKFALNKENQRAGCFNAACAGHGLKNSVGLIAYFEGLDTRDHFSDVLARGVEILGLKTKLEEPAPNKTSNPTPTPPTSPKDSIMASRETVDRLHLCHQVYSRILNLSPLEDRDKKFWRIRGVSYATIEKGRFGSMSAERAAYIKDRLCNEFGRQELVRYVPGFSENPETGKLVFTLAGEYTLIPYHDQRGNVTTIEGRAIGEPREGMGKYVSLRGSGNHLYVFPGLDASALEAVTEGSIGAIVAADNGLAVGAIQGCERYRASSSKIAPNGEPGGPLMEMAGVNWASRVVPYIPDADDPPNPQVIAAAPKAARHLARSGGGAPAIARLPNGVDLDEWLLSISHAERRLAFNQLLSQAEHPLAYETPRANHVQGVENVDEDEVSAAIVEPQPDQSLRLKSGKPPASGDSGDSLGSQKHPAKPRSSGSPKAAAKQARGQEASGAATQPAGTAQSIARHQHKLAVPDLTTSDSEILEVSRAPSTNGATSPSSEAANTREGTEATEAGAPADLVDQVYRRLLEICPPLQTHLEALEALGVMREVAAAGNFGSVDHDRCLEVARVLAKEIAPTRLLQVPGFDRTGAGAIRFSLSGDYLLLPCYDSDGFLRGIEALAHDPVSGRLDAEETVQLSGAGSHLYVFAPYHPAAIEGFCEGILGALLAAQDDVVIGAIGGFRRYKAASGEGARAQPTNAVLPELEGVDFAGMELPYAPRSAASESNARAHEAAPATRWLIEKQNGVPKLSPLPSIYKEYEEVGEEVDEEVNESDSALEDPEGPEDREASDAAKAAKVTQVDSLGKWILALPHEESAERLRELFPEVPALTEPQESAQGSGDGSPCQTPGPSPLSTRVAYAAVAISAVVAGIVSSLINAAWRFSSYTTAASSGEVIVPGGLLGQLQSVTGSLPFEILYLLRGPLAILVGLLVGLRIVRYLTRGPASHSTARSEHHTHHADAVGEGRIDEPGSNSSERSGDRWRRHLLSSPGPTPRSAIRRGQVLAAVLAWVVVFALAWPGLVLAGIIYSFSVKVDPGTAGVIFDYPMLAAVAVAAGAALYAVSKRADIARKEVQLLSGYLPKETRKRSWLSKLFAGKPH